MSSYRLASLESLFSDTQGVCLYDIHGKHFLPGRRLLVRLVLYKCQNPIYANNLYIEGNIFYLNLMGRHTVVINSIEIARELLDRKGATFSDRPHSVLIGDLYVLTIVFPVHR